MFGFPAQNKPDGFRLINNLLRSATFQLKYKASKDVQSETSQLVSILLPIFPIVKQINKARLEANVSSANEAPQFNSEIKPSGLQFSIEGDTKLFVLNEEAITMTFSGEVYENFSIAYAEFSRIIHLVVPILSVKTFSRVAIRKINGLQCETDPPSKEGIQPWKIVLQDIFSPESLAGFNVLPGNHYAVSYLSHNRLSIGDNRLNLVYGIPTKEIKQNTRQALLDIDIANVSEDTPIDSIDDLFSAINSEIYNVFIWTIKPDFLQAVNSHTLPIAES